MHLARKTLCAVVWGPLFALCLSLALPASLAHAVTPQQKAQARELYAKGQQLFREGNYLEAERSFEEAYRIVPNAVVLLSIAECQTRSEQYQKAIETLQAYLREKPDAKDAPEVRTQIEALQSKPAKLTISSDVPGAEVWVDETNTGSVTPTELTLSAGSHWIALLRDGYQRTEQSVQLAPGERANVSLTLVPEPTPVAPPPAVAEPVADEPRGPRHITPAFWAATGVGIAALATGIALGGVALKKEKDYNDNPSAKTADQGERMALGCDIALGVAGAAAVTALVVYLTSGKKGEQQQQQAWSVGPSLGRGVAGAAASTRF